MQGQNIAPWMQFFKNLMDRPMPEEIESFTEDMEEISKRDISLLWKIKGKAA